MGEYWKASSIIYIYIYIHAGGSGVGHCLAGCFSQKKATFFKAGCYAMAYQGFGTFGALAVRGAGVPDRGEMEKEEKEKGGEGVGGS